MPARHDDLRARTDRERNAREDAERGLRASQADCEALRAALKELRLDASEAELRQVGLALNDVLAQVCISIYVRACVRACV